MSKNGSDHEDDTKTKYESLPVIDKSLATNNCLSRDLEILGRTPYQIGVEGEKFRVVAATLQKCNSPFVQRTFHFTANGIVEALNKKSSDAGESGTIIPILKRSVNRSTTHQKVLRIRRFRVIKKEDLILDKCTLPKKIKIANGEKTTRFLTVRIRSKNLNSENGFPLVQSEGSTSLGREETVETVSSTTTTTTITTENINESEQIENDKKTVTDSDLKNDDADAATTEENCKEKTEDAIPIKLEEIERETAVKETFTCENCGKQFSTYLHCLTHIRSHQKQSCQFCSKRFLTAKILRDHIKIQHPEESTRCNVPEDRITTATSKFGRTRQVLNIAGLRSKYRML